MANNPRDETLNPAELDALGGAGAEGLYPENYFPLDMRPDFSEVSTNPAMQASVSPVEEFFDLDTRPQEDLDSIPSTDPTVVEKRAAKADLALGNTSPGFDTLANQMANGDEPALRRALAAQKTIEDRKFRLNMVREATSKVNRPLTPDEADELMSMAGVDSSRDPGTILEELYGQKLVSEIPAMMRDPSIHQEALNNLPDEYLDAADATAQHIAKNQIAKAVSEDMESEWKQAGVFDTVMSYAKQLVPFWSYSNLLGAAEKSPTPFSFQFGNSIEEDVEYLYSLRPSEFKKQLTAAVRKIAEDSPLDAMIYAQGVINYSNNDKAMDTIFGAMDMTSFVPFLSRGGTIGRIGESAFGGIANRVVRPGSRQVAKYLYDLINKTDLDKQFDTIARDFDKAVDLKTTPPKDSGLETVRQQPSTVPGISVTFDNATASGMKVEGDNYVLRTPGSATPAPTVREGMERYPGVPRHVFEAMPKEYIRDPVKAGNFIRQMAVIRSENAAGDIAQHVAATLRGTFEEGGVKSTNKHSFAAIEQDVAFPLAQQILKRVEVGMSKGQNFDTLMERHLDAIDVWLDDIYYDYDMVAGTGNGFKSSDEVYKFLRDRVTMTDFVKAYDKGPGKGLYTHIGDFRPKFEKNMKDLMAFTKLPDLTQESAALRRGKPLYSLTLNKNDILKRTTQRAKGFYQDVHKGGKDALYTFLKSSGLARSILNSPLHDEKGTAKAIDELLQGIGELHPEVRKRVDAFMDETFEPWPTYSFEREAAEAQIHKKTGAAAVLVDPEYVDWTVGKRIKAGNPLYEDANLIPTWVARDPSLLFEQLLWHETAHVALGGRLKEFGLTISQEENLVNAIALAKTRQQRLKAGLRDRTTVPFGKVEQPIPHVNKAPSPATGGLREPAVVFNDVALPEYDLRPTTKPGHTRLYRVEVDPKHRKPVSDWIKDGQRNSGHTAAEGRWFVADTKMLDFYINDTGADRARIVAIDVPTADLEKFRVSKTEETVAGRSPKSFSKDPENEFFLPSDVSSRAIPLTKRIQPYTRYDPTTRTLTVNRPALVKQFEQKPWLKTKKAGVAPIGTPDDFKTADDWVNFSVEKAKLKAVLPKRKGEDFATYENRVNDLALQSHRVQKEQTATVRMNVMQDTARAGTAETSPEGIAAIGMTQEAAAIDVYTRVRNEFKNLDPLGDSMALIKRTVSLFSVDELGNTPFSLSRQSSDRILNALRRNATTLLGIPLNNSAIVRLPEAALQKAIEEAKSVLSSTYNHANDAFLDISFGGPFGITRPEDQLVNTTVVHLRMGMPNGQLFDNPVQAAVYGQDMYGLSANNFTILQQGNGFYINIAKSVDETLDSVRNLLIETNNQSQGGFLNAFLGLIRTPEDILSKMTNENRKLATTAAQEVHRLMLDASKSISKNLSKREKEQLQAIWEHNRDYIDEATGDRGMFHTSIGELEDAFAERFRQMPSEKQIEAYFTYVQLNDIDYVLRNLALHRDLARIGAENVRVFYDAVDELGQATTKSSRGFAGRLTDRIPFEDTSEDFGVWVYDSAKKKGEFFLRSQMTREMSEDITTRLGTHGYKVIEVVNPLEKPLLDVAATSETIHFVVTKNFENTKFDWSVLPRRPGGHVEYGDQFFVKQPRLRRSTASGMLRHIYEGDTSILSAATGAEAKRLAIAADDARKLLKAGDEDALKRFLYQNTPWDIGTFKSFFSAKQNKDGTWTSALLNLDDAITWTYTGRNTSDMDHFKGTLAGYGNFFNGVRSKYNLFAQNVDKKYLGSRDPDLPRAIENGTEANPLYTLGKPRLLSPLDTLNKSLANVSRSRYMNDFKTTAVENFVNEFWSVMKTPLAELRRNPVYYFHNPVWDTETTNKTLLAAAKATRRANVMFIGAESELGSKMFWLQSKLVDKIYQKLGQKASDYVTEKYLPTVKDPFTYARSIAFHAKLGLFNPVQLMLQAQSFVHVAAIAGPKMAGKAAFDGLRMRQLALTENEDIIAQYARWSGAGADLFKESYKELKNTGFYNVGGEVAWRDDVFDPDLFKGSVGTFLEKGAWFFNEGERFVRLSAWNSAFYAWREANPGVKMTNAIRNQILQRADLMSVNMTRASNAAWQEGLLSIPTQFLAFQARLAEQMLPGFSSRLTAAEKGRAFATYSAIYGVPVGAAAATAVWPYYEDVRQAALERGVHLDENALTSFHGGITNSVLAVLSWPGLLDAGVSTVTGKDYNINQRYGPGGTTLFKEIINGEKSVVELVVGASGSIIGDMISSAEPATNALMSLFDKETAMPTMEDFLEVTRNISSINNVARAWMMYNQGIYMTRNGTVVTNNNTGFDAFMTGVLGTTPQGVTDTFTMLKSQKEQREVEKEAMKEVASYYRKAIREYNNGDEDLGNTYLRRAKAWLASSGIRPDKYHEVLRSAIKGHESLFNSVREDFWRKGPASQTEARRAMIMEQQK